MVELRIKEKKKETEPEGHALVKGPVDIVIRLKLQRNSIQMLLSCETLYFSM